MTETDQFFNYYEILAVPPQATPDDIYRAYAQLKKTYSLRNPDIFKNFTFDELQDLILLIEEAYSTLGNQDTREIYDQKFQVLTHRQQEPLVKPSPEEEVAVEQRATTVDKKTVTEVTTPTGLGKTPLSTYRVDETLESLIVHQDFFDGKFLGKIRRYKNVELEDLSKTTCISMKYLYALEDDNYSALPAGVFTRGYVHQYCKILGLEAERVLPSFMKLFNNGRK